MRSFNIKVTEYGIKSRNKDISPAHFTWDYCIKKKIPYIIVKPKIRFTSIEYDMLTINDGIDFKEGNTFVDHWCEMYEDYLIESKFPKKMIPKRIIGVVCDNFTVFKKDQGKIIQSLMKELEEYVNEYGIINPVRKRYFRMTKNNSLT
jgi:hypothetical protein